MKSQFTFTSLLQVIWRYSRLVGKDHISSVGNTSFSLNSSGELKVTEQLGIFVVVFGGGGPHFILGNELGYGNFWRNKLENLFLTELLEENFFFSILVKPWGQYSFASSNVHFPIASAIWMLTCNIKQMEEEMEKLESTRTWLTCSYFVLMQIEVLWEITARKVCFFLKFLKNEFKDV